MAVGVVEVDYMADGFLERLLGLVFHHDRVAKAAVEALEDVPAVVATNGFSDLALVVAGQDFTSSRRLDSASFFPSQLVVLRESACSTRVPLQHVADSPGINVCVYTGPSGVLLDVLHHDVSARMTHALVEPMDLLHDLGGDACVCLVPQAAERDLSGIRIDSSIPSNDRSFLD